MKTQQIQIQILGLKDILEDLNIRHIENNVEQVTDKNQGALKKICNELGIQYFE